MALYNKWDVKNDFAYVLQFFSLISDSLGSVCTVPEKLENKADCLVNTKIQLLKYKVRKGPLK